MAVLHASVRLRTARAAVDRHPLVAHTLGVLKHTLRDDAMFGDLALLLAGNRPGPDRGVG
jgi:hypothetical protein